MKTAQESQIFSTYAQLPAKGENYLINGKTEGIKQNILDELELLYEAQCPRGEFLTQELADALAKYSCMLNRGHPGPFGRALYSYAPGWQLAPFGCGRRYAAFRADGLHGGAGCCRRRAQEPVRRIYRGELGRGGFCRPVFHPQAAQPFLDGRD